jgi:hypothetical protein
MPARTNEGISMIFAVDNLVFHQQGNSTTQSGVAIYGTPLHCEHPGELVSRYGAVPLPDFLASEARRSIGNYVLVDFDRGRIITSPGYCGGYGYAGHGEAVASTTLAPVLAVLGDRISIDSYAISLFLTHAPKSAYNQLPISTHFEGVFRIPPAALIEFQGGERTVFRSYIMDRPDQPASFEAAIEEISDSLARHFTRNRINPVLMFSGGVDCFTIYLGLRGKIPEFRSLTVEHNTANGPDRAFAVADKVGMALELVKETYSQSAFATAVLDSRMEKDIISGRGPAVAMIEKDFGGTVILNGQNADALAHINMNVLQSNFEKPLLSNLKWDQSEKDEALRLRQYDVLFSNLMFTRPFLVDKRFQTYVATAVSKVTKGTIPDPEPGPNGILRGMISSQYPNLLPKMAAPVDQVASLQKEVDLFKAFAGPAMKDMETAVQLIRYYTYAALSAKRLSTFANPDGSRCELVIQSGPILSYFLGRQRKLADAASPKAELYAYVRKKTGKAYSALAKRSRPNFDQRKLDKTVADPLLVRNMDWLNPAASSILPRIADQKVREHIAGIYRHVAETAKPDHPNVTLFSQTRGRYIINLEKLVRHASSKGQDIATKGDGVPAARPAPAKRARARREKTSV